MSILHPGIMERLGASVKVSCYRRSSIGTASRRRRRWQGRLRKRGKMIMLLVLKIIDRIGTDDPGVYWYGAAFALIFDVFLISLLVYWLRTL
jgi:hypothetical protein